MLAIHLNQHHSNSQGHRVISENKSKFTSLTTEQINNEQFSISKNFVAYQL